MPRKIIFHKNKILPTETIKYNTKSYTLPNKIFPNNYIIKGKLNQTNIDEVTTIIGIRSTPNLTTIMYTHKTLRKKPKTYILYAKQLYALPIIILHHYRLTKD